MRILFAIIVAAALGWSGYWYISSTRQVGLLEDWLGDRRGDGWVAEAGDISAAGFPNRVDVTVSDLQLSDPGSGWAWNAGEFNILTLSYKPNHIIAVWPGEQVVASPYETITADSENLRGSVVFEPDSGLALQRATIEAEGLKLVSDAGWNTDLGKAVLATRLSEGEDAPANGHDIGLDIDELELPEYLLRNYDAGGALPAPLGPVRLDAALGFAVPLDRPSVEAGIPGVEDVRIRDLDITWGELSLRGKGRLVADSRGFASGRLDLRVRNWREMLDFAVDSNLVADEIAAALQAGLGLIAALSGDSDTLKVPLEFENGKAKIGPVSVGDAPRLSYRPAG